MRYAKDGSVLIEPKEFHEFLDADLYAKINDATAPIGKLPQIVTIATFLGRVVGDSMHHHELENAIATINNIVRRMAISQADTY